MSELSERVFDRAQKLEDVLSRVAGVENVLYQMPPKRSMELRWVSPNSYDIHTVYLNEQFLRGMTKIAVTLFTDLKREGEIVLARDIVEQHEAVREELMDSRVRPRGLIEDALRKGNAT